MASAAGLSSAEAYTKLKAEATELLKAVAEEGLAPLLDAPASDAHADAHIDLSANVGAYFGAYYKLRKRLERESLSVAVLALTKSGKSTLINAFLGSEILPVNNVPETARICRISHVPAASCPKPVLELLHSGGTASRSSSLVSAGSSACSHALEGMLGTSPPSATHAALDGAASTDSGSEGCEVLVGAAAIREHLQQLNRDVRAREHLRNDEKILNISAPLVVLDNGTQAGGAGGADAAGDAAADLSSIQLCLLDTPGPNEAGEEGLKYQVERLLGRVDAAIYLLDYTKLKTAEEAGVLGRLKAINPALVARLCSRLFFAVNKMDQADESCGLDDDQTRAYVAEIVTQQLDCPDFKLHPDQVLLLSARDALLSRLILSGRSDPANTQRFCRIAFGAFNAKPRGSSSSTQNPADVPPNSLAGAGGRSIPELRAAAEGLLGGSGVPELEERVLGFLCEAAAGVKLMATLDDTGRLLAEVSNVSSSCRAALAASSSALAAKTAALQSELDSTLSHFDRVMEGTAELQVEVTDELRAHLSNLRTRLFQYIANALDCSSSAHAAAGASGVGGDEQEEDNDAEDAAAEAGGYGDEEQQQHHRRRRRPHGCCHSRHRRRHGGYSSSSAGGPGGAAAAGGFGAGGSCSGFGGFAAASSSTYAGADVFTGCMPGGAGAYPSSFNGSSSSSYTHNGGSSSARSVPVATPPAGGVGSSGSGGWWGLRQRFLSLFGRVSGSNGGGSGASGSSESRDELSSALMDLSEDLMAQIQAEVAEAWHVMEAATNDRAARLTATLNGHITQLSAQLEGAVNEALQIQLEPVSLRLAAPDAVQFHADLTDLIEKGIRAQQTRHVRTGERTDFVMEARRGSCRLTQYYVQVPRRRRIVETYTATTYSLAPEAVLDHFMGVVDEAVSATEASLPGYVREYVRRQVEQARDRVQAYGSRYVGSLSAALEATSAGAEARQAALDQVSAYCCAFDRLRARLAGLQARAELLVPHNTASGCGLFEQVFEAEEEEGEEGVEEEQVAEEQEGAGFEQQEEEQEAAKEEEEELLLPEPMEVEVEGQAAAAAAEGAAAAAAGAAAIGAAAAAFTAAAAADADDEDAVDSDDDDAGSSIYSDTSRDLHAAVVDEPAAAPAAAEEQEEQEGDAAAADSTPAAAAVAAMGSSSFFAAPFGALASWMASSSSTSRDAAAPTADGDQQLPLLLDHDIEGALPAAAAAAGAAAQAAEAADGAAAAGAADSEEMPDLLDQDTLYPAADDLSSSGGSDDGSSEQQGMPDLMEVDDDCQQQPTGAAAAARAARAAARVEARAAARAAAPADAAATAAAVDAAADDSDDADIPAPGLRLDDETDSEDVADGADGGSSGRRISSGSGTSAVSAAETAVSDSFSLVSGAATGSSAFSGMTANTAFTLASTTSSTVSRQQEHLADSVLMGVAVGAGAGAAAAAVAEEGRDEEDEAAAAEDMEEEAEQPEPAPAVVAAVAQEQEAGTAAPVAVAAAGSESLYASMMGSGLLLSADDVAGALQMSALPAAVDEQDRSTPAAAAVEAAAVAPAAPAPAPAAVAEPWQGDASLYASIIAHSEDLEQQPGSPFNFGESFAAALTAAGLDSLAAGGPSPPSGSPRESGSEDWQIVEAEVEGAARVGGGGGGGGGAEAAAAAGEGQADGAAASGSGAPAQEVAAEGGSSSRGWLLRGGRGKA